jgi:flagellar hook assembly protein FlgD
MDNITHFGLEVYPNPFKNRLDIRWQITDTQMQDARSKNQDISLKIYDVAGRLIKDFNLSSNINRLTSPITWQGDDDMGRYVSSGVYFVKFEHNRQSRIEKIVKIH